MIGQNKHLWNITCKSLHCNSNSSVNLPKAVKPATAICGANTSKVRKEHPETRPQLRKQANILRIFVTLKLLWKVPTSELFFALTLLRYVSHLSVSESYFRQIDTTHLPKPDGIHPNVLTELKDEITKPLIAESVFSFKMIFVLEKWTLQIRIQNF